MRFRLISRGKHHRQYTTTQRAIHPLKSAIYIILKCRLIQRWRFSEYLRLSILPKPIYLHAIRMLYQRNNLRVYALNLRYRLSVQLSVAQCTAQSYAWPPEIRENLAVGPGEGGAAGRQSLTLSETA